MAELTVQGGELVLQLSTVEEAEAIHGEVRVPLSAVREVEVLDDALGEVHGIRAPGTGFPGVVAVGTYLHAGARTFAVIHHGARRGVRVRLEGAEFDALIVGCADPESVAASLRPDLDSAR